MILDLEEERQRHAQDTAEGDDVTYMLEKERERLTQQVTQGERAWWHLLRMTFFRFISSVQYYIISLQRGDRMFIVSVSKTSSFLNIGYLGLGIWLSSPVLKAHTAFAEDPSLAPSTYIR